jgi:hypothetical protein
VTEFVQFGDRICSIIDSGVARKARTGFTGSPVLAVGLLRLLLRKLGEAKFSNA